MDATRAGIRLGSVAIAVGAVVWMAEAPADAHSQVASGFASPQPGINDGYLQWHTFHHANNHGGTNGLWDVRIDRYFGMPGTNSCNYQAKIDRWYDGDFQNSTFSSFHAGCTSGSSPSGIYFDFEHYGDAVDNHLHYQAGTSFNTYWRDGYTSNGQFEKALYHNF